jgi:hypothetical protein
MSYMRPNVTNIRQVFFDLQVNQCMALLGITANPPGPRVAFAMPSIPESLKEVESHWTNTMDVAPFLVFLSFFSSRKT